SFETSAIALCLERCVADIDFPDVVAIEFACYLVERRAVERKPSLAPRGDLHRIERAPAQELAIRRNAGFFARDEMRGGLHDRRGVLHRYLDRPFDDRHRRFIAAATHVELRA